MRLRKTANLGRVNAYLLRRRDVLNQVIEKVNIASGNVHFSQRVCIGLAVRLHETRNMRREAVIENLLRLWHASPVNRVGVAQARDAMVRTQTFNQLQCAWVKTAYPGSKGVEKGRLVEWQFPFFDESSREHIGGDTPSLEKCDGLRLMPAFEYTLLIVQMRREGLQRDDACALDENAARVEHDYLGLFDSQLMLRIGIARHHLYHSFHQGFD